MIEALVLAVGAATVGLGASSAAWFVGKKRGTADAEAAADRRLAMMQTQRDTAERKAAAALQESSRWKGLSLAGQPFQGAPVYEGRVSARDAEELARLLRGLTLIDDVVIADSSGLPLTREQEGRSAQLASLAASTFSSMRRLAPLALPIAQLHFETFAAEHVCARPLVGRADGAMLLVRTTSQRANPLAVDAVVHASAKTVADLSNAAALPPLLVGSSERVEASGPRLAELSSLLDRALESDLRGIMLCADGVPLISAAKDGPAASVRRSLAMELSFLEERSSRALRATGLARLELVLRTGEAITLAALAPRSRFSVVTFGQLDTRSAARMDRLLGSLRRLLAGDERIAEDRALEAGGGFR